MQNCFAEYLCEQFEFGEQITISETTKLSSFTERVQTGSKLFDTLMLFMKELFKEHAKLSVF